MDDRIWEADMGRTGRHAGGGNAYTMLRLLGLWTSSIVRYSKEHNVSETGSTEYASPTPSPEIQFPKRCEYRTMEKERKKQ
jgi:hypothetical protein